MMYYVRRLRLISGYASTLTASSASPSRPVARRSLSRSAGNLRRRDGIRLQFARTQTENLNRLSDALARLAPRSL
ncbi:MAG: hypothetical protein ACR2GR_07665 [Rhodothermales bacterium]